MTFSSVFGAVSRQLLVFLAVLLAGAVLFAWTQMAVKKYVATSTVLAVTANANESSMLDPQKDPSSAALYPVDVAALIKSSTVTRRVAEDLHTNDAGALSAKISSKDTNVFDIIPISFTDRDAARAVEGDNAVVKELVRYDHEIVTSRYDALILDLKSQLQGWRAKLRALDARIAALTAKDPYLVPTGQTGGISDRLIALEKERQTLEEAMMGDAAKSAMVARAPGMARDAAGEEIIDTDPRLTALRTQMGKDLAELYLQRAGYTNRFPGLPGMQERVKRERASLAREEQRAIASPSKSATYVRTLLAANDAYAAFAEDRARLAAVDGQIRQMAARWTASGHEAAVVASLVRDRTADAQTYADLSARLAKAIGDRSQAASIDTIVVIDTPSAAKLTLFSRPAVLGAAFAVAFLWLAVTLAVVLDGIDARMRSREAIQDVYRRPVFGAVG